MSESDRHDPIETDIRDSDPNADAPGGLAGGMGVSSERVGATGPGQEAANGVRDTSVDSGPLGGRRAPRAAARTARVEPRGPRAQAHPRLTRGEPMSEQPETPQGPVDPHGEGGIDAPAPPGGPQRTDAPGGPDTPGDNATDPGSSEPDTPSAARSPSRCTTRTPSRTRASGRCRRRTPRRPWTSPRADGVCAVDAVHLVRRIYRAAVGSPVDRGNRQGHDRSRPVSSRPRQPHVGHRQPAVRPAPDRRSAPAVALQQRPDLARRRARTTEDLPHESRAAVAARRRPGRDRARSRGPAARWSRGTAVRRARGPPARSRRPGRPHRPSRGPGAAAAATGSPCARSTRCR